MGKKQKIVHFILGIVLCFSFVCGLWGQNKGVKSGERYDRLVIRNVFLIDGKGTPLKGPMDVILRNNKIESVRGAVDGDRYSKHNTITASRNNLDNSVTPLLRSKRCLTNVLT